MANGPVNPKLHKDLLLACGWGKEIDVVLLLQQGASVKVQDQNGRNCLHYAASKGHTNIVEILLLKKCNANAKDKYGSTPLHQAAVNGHTECASTLIEGGADVNFQDDNGNTPLYEAVWNNQVETVDLLLNNESDVNIRNKEGYTPLHLACQNNYGKIIQNLVKWGANLQSPTSAGNTPLHIAIQNSQIDAVKTLLSLEADINIQNHDGDTPLHLCAEHGDKKITKLLLESGQPYEPSLNNVGDSPKDIAVQLGNKEVADLIPTPKIARKYAKKGEVPGSPKRTPKQKSSSVKCKTTQSSENENSNSLERPVQVVVQPPSVDNLVATDTCSSLSSLWLPAPDSGGNLPMDVYWQKSMSPSPERKGKNFENITDLKALKEIKKSDQHSQSDGSGIKSPRYQIRKKRRKYITGNSSGKHKIKDEEIEDFYENGRESRRNKDSKTSKLFKKKKSPSGKKSSSKRLKRVLEQGEDEISLMSPVSQDKSETTAGLASPRVKGRAEMRTALITQLKEGTKTNGTLNMDQVSLEENIQQKKGLREFLKDSLVTRKTPTNTDEGSSSKTGTLEHKKGKDGRLGHSELREHMKLTEKDVEALLTKEFLANAAKENKYLAKHLNENKKITKRNKKKIYGSEEEDGGEEIVVIRLDQKLEMPKKSKRVKERKSLENGVQLKEDDSFSKGKKEKYYEFGANKEDTIKRRQEKSSAKKENEKRGERSKKEDDSRGTLRKEKKSENKEWPKFEVLVDEACGIDGGPSGVVSPQERVSHSRTERSHRHHKRSGSVDLPSKESTFEKIHKLEKRFKHFLQLTTEKLDEQKEIDNKHYSELKHDISSMEKNLERTTRNSAVEMIETVAKELDSSMKKWTRALRSMTKEGRGDGRREEGSSDASSDAVRLIDNDRQIITTAIVSKPHFESEAFKTSTLERTKMGGNLSMVGRENGHVVRDETDDVSKLDYSIDSIKEEKEKAINGCDSGERIEGPEGRRAAPQGRSDESPPCPLSRHPGDGDHMNLEKWYQEQLREAEERWRLKAEADQQALRNRIKELEDTLYQFTGAHNTMV